MLILAWDLSKGLEKLKPLHPVYIHTHLAATPVLGHGLPHTYPVTQPAFTGISYTLSPVQDAEEQG